MHGRDIVTIETPEHVVFHYELAGVMSRILAAGIDALFQLIIAVVILLVLGLAAGFGGVFGEEFGADVSMVACATVGILLFVDIWGYSILTELFMRGQTPGKRALGLRVIREGGYALSAGDVIVRNLLRIADFLPVGYVLGMFVICLNRRNKRIGDFVAGTLVIRDAPAGPPPRQIPVAELRKLMSSEAAIDDLRRAGVHGLTPEHVMLVESFLERRATLEVNARYELGRRVAAPIADRLGVAPPSHPERFLQDVLLAYRESQPASVDSAAEARPKAEGP